MSAITTTDGSTVSLFRSSPMVSPDAGVPLQGYSAQTTDPLSLWKTQPSLRKVVSFAARQVASVSWHAFERVSDTDRRRVSDSPAEQLLARPSRFMSGFRFWQLLTTDAMMYDLYCAVLLDGELVRVPPRHLKIHSDYLGRPDGITLVTAQGQDNIDLTAFPLMLGWGWAPSAAGGVSPLMTLSQILDESRRAVEWRRQQWDHSPKFNGVLKHPTQFKDQEKKSRFLESFRQWRDADGGTPLLENGIEYEQLGEMPGSRDAENVAGRQLTDQEVASAYHIPPELVGARQGNFSNIAAFRQMLFGPTLGPQFKDFRQALNAEIVAGLDGRGGVYAEPNLQEAISGSFMEQAQVLQTMTGGPVMTRAEARAKLNLPYIAGTEELIVPMNVTDGGLASPTDTGAQNRQQAVQPAAVTRKAVPAGGQLLKATDPGELGGANEQREELVAALGNIYARQRSEVLADGGPGAAAEFHRRWDAEVAEAVRGPLGAAALAGAWEVLRSYNPDAEGWAAEAMDGYLDEMANTTASRVNSGVVEATSEAAAAPAADDERDQGERISNSFAVLASASAVAFGSVVTEARGFGGHDAAQVSGVASKTWLVTSSNPRESHAAMHGETVGIHERFSNGAKWPGDGSGLSVDDMAGCMCGVEWTTG